MRTQLKRTALLAALAVVAGSAHIPAEAGTVRQGVSALQIQNVDPTETAQIGIGLASLRPDFYGFGTSLIAPPMRAANLHLGYLPSSARLGTYAGYMQSESPIAAIARTEWPDTGGAMLYSNASPSRDLLVPLVAKFAYGQTSHLSVQPAERYAEAHLSISLVSTDGRELPPLEIRLEGGTEPHLQADLGSDTLFADVPAGFLGSARITSDLPVAVATHIDLVRSPKAVYGFEGVPVRQAASRLYVPLFRRDYYGTTGISVANAGTEPVRTRVKYIGTLGSCVGRWFEQWSEISARSSVVFWQGGDVDGVSPNHLPVGCAGSAVIEAVEPTDGRLVAMVNDASAPDGTSAAYNAFTDAQGSTRVALPLFRSGHMPRGANMSTGIQAMNIGDDVANAHITYFDSEGNELDQEGVVTIGSLASFTWFQPHIIGNPADVYGSAIIESDQPLAVVVNDASFALDPSNRMDSAIYNGVKADETYQETSILAPFLLREVGLRK